MSCRIGRLLPSTQATWCSVGSEELDPCGSSYITPLTSPHHPFALKKLPGLGPLLFVNSLWLRELRGCDA